MALTNYKLCVRYLEKTVLPYLRLKFKIDAEHLKHKEGDNFAWIILDAPTNFEDIKGYVGITIWISEVANPIIETPYKPPTISGGIIGIGNDGHENLQQFAWKSLEEMQVGVISLKLDSAIYRKCVTYFENEVLPCIRQKFPELDVELDSGNNHAWISLEEQRNFEDVIGYTGVYISVHEDNNRDVLDNIYYPTISGCILSNDGHRKETTFLWYSLDEMVKGINDLK